MNHANTQFIQEQAAHPMPPAGIAFRLVPIINPANEPLTPAEQINRRDISNCRQQLTTRSCLPLCAPVCPCVPLCALVCPWVPLCDPVGLMCPCVPLCAPVYHCVTTNSSFLACLIVPSELPQHEVAANSSFLPCLIVPSKLCAECDDES